MREIAHVSECIFQLFVKGLLPDLLITVTMLQCSRHLELKCQTWQNDASLVMLQQKS